MNMNIKTAKDHTCVQLGKGGGGDGGGGGVLPEMFCGGVRSAS